MNAARTLAGALLAALLLAAPAAARPGLPTVVQDDAQLLDRPPAQVAASMRQIAALGADWVRLSANWSVLAPDPASPTRPAFDATDPAAYPQAQWAALDTAVRAAHAAGLHVMLDAAYWAPLWATRSAPGPRARVDVDPAEFADFAVALARRYRGDFAVPAPVAPAPPAPPPLPPDQSALEQLLGLLPLGAFAADAAPAAGGPLPAIDSLVLWNEPNFPAFLLPQWHGSHPAVADVYRAMVQDAYPAVKAVSPGLTVLIGNTTGSGGDAPPSGVRPLAFLRALACVDSRLRPLHTGVCADFRPVPGDGWAHHPYSNATPAEVSRGGQRDNARIGDLPRLAALLDALVARHRLAPGVGNIYITEYGFETEAPTGRWSLSRAAAQQRQSQVLTWAEYLAQRVPSVRMFAQFLLRDVPPGTARVSDSPLRGFGQFYSGLLFAGGAPKLAARTFRVGLLAERAAGGAVRLSGRLRLGPGRCRVELQAAPAHRAFANVARSLVLGCQDSLVREIPTRGVGGRYRLRVHVGGTPDGSGQASGWLDGVAERAVG